LVAAALLAACVSAPGETSYPVYEVGQSGLSPGVVDALLDALGLPAVQVQDGDGSVRYIHDDFQALPMQALSPEGSDYFEDEDGQELTFEGFNLPAVQNLPEYPLQTALNRVTGAVDGAVPQAFRPGAKATAANSMFDAFDAAGSEVVSKAIDTQVNYEFTLSGLPLIGPGAKLKVAFDGSGNPTMLFAALRSLSAGDSGPIVPQAEATAQVMERLRSEGLGAQELSTLQLTSRLVYYSPSPFLPAVQRIVPHYQIGGTFQSGGESVQIREFFLPAVQDRPTVTLEVVYEPDMDHRVTATAKVSGGRGPYTFHWSSATQEIEQPKVGSEDQVVYFLTAWRDQETLDFETIQVVVTDSDGLEAVASHTIEDILIGLDETVSPASLTPQAFGQVDVGTEWVGVSQGLDRAAANATGFVNRMLAGSVPVQFNYGDYAAWERDFKEPGIGNGQDDDYVDFVDLVFYTGHANANRFTFPGERDDGSLHYSEAVWGNWDLEWIVIAACGPLQLGSPPTAWHQRWGPAFDGLHLILAYATVSADNTTEGGLFANHILGNSFFFWSTAARSIRQAWAMTATEVQPSSVTYGIMGVYGADGLTSYNDYFWGRGPVSPDLRGTQKKGYWLILSPS
jgi:hypothetical protein